jgi:hypothetical protein
VGEGENIGNLGDWDSFAVPITQISDFYAIVYFVVGGLNQVRDLVLDKVEGECIIGVVYTLSGAGPASLSEIVRV